MCVKRNSKGAAKSAAKVPISTAANTKSRLSFFCRFSWTQTLNGFATCALRRSIPIKKREAEIWAAKKRQDTSLFTALLSLPPTAMPIAVAPPTVTMMAMVIVPVVMMAMVIVAVVNRRTKIVLGSGFADWRHRSRYSA